MRLLVLAMAVALTTGTAGCAVRSSAPQQSATTEGAAAGVATAGSAVPVPTASQSPGAPPPTLTGNTTVTVADDQATVRLRPGQSVTVVLAPTGIFAWHLPTLTGTAIRQVTSRGGYPDQQPAQATFIAIQPGTAAVQSIDDTACLHAKPACLPAQRQWRITVIVS